MSQKCVWFEELVRDYREQEELRRPPLQQAFEDTAPANLSRSEFQQ